MANVWILTERQQNIDLYLQACANLYGHITPKQFLLIYNKYNADKLLKAELLQYSNKLNRQAKNYRIYSNAIINTAVESEIIDRTIYLQANKKYYVPDKEELLNWVNEKYRPVTPQSKKLQNVLIRKFGISPLAIDSLMYELFHSVLIDERTQAQSDIFDRYHVFAKSSKNDFYEFYSTVFIQFVNNTPRWANCGFTPTEMRLFMKFGNE